MQLIRSKLCRKKNTISTVVFKYGTHAIKAILLYLINVLEYNSILLKFLTKLCTKLPSLGDIRRNAYRILYIDLAMREKLKWD